MPQAWVNNELPLYTARNTVTDGYLTIAVLKQADCGRKDTFARLADARPRATVYARKEVLTILPGRAVNVAKRVG